MAASRAAATAEVADIPAEILDDTMTLEEREGYKAYYAEHFPLASRFPAMFGLAATGRN